MQGRPFVSHKSGREVKPMVLELRARRKGSRPECAAS